MYHNLFSCSTVDGHLHYFQFGNSVNSIAQPNVLEYVFCWHMHINLGLELLGQKTWCSIFINIAKQFSKVVAPHSIQNLVFPHPFHFSLFHFMWVVVLWFYFVFSWWLMKFSTFSYMFISHFMFFFGRWFKFLVHFSFGFCVFFSFIFKIFK